MAKLVKPHKLIEFDNSADLGRWYDKKYTKMGGGWKIGKEEANRLIKWAGFDRDINKQLLDIGCGDGDFVAQISNYFTCVGIDLSMVGIKYCKDRGLPAIFYQQDIQTANSTIFRDGRFDYLTSIGSIEHVVNLDRALANCYRILKDDGKFLCMVPNELWEYLDQPQEQTHTDEEWSKIFKKAGFKIEKVNRRNDLTDFVLIK